MMTLRYLSGEEIKKGDRVLFHGEPGEIEFVAVDPKDRETGWYVQQYGGGVMVADKIAGHTFIPADQIADTEDLEFVSGTEGNSTRAKR